MLSSDRPKRLRPPPPELAPPFVRGFAERVGESLIERSPPWFEGRRAFLLDGTTITLSPTSPLCDAYPPATNQHGETVWPVMLRMVAHELQSGCVLIPELDAMYGPNNTAEGRQAAAIGRRIRANSLFLADAGLGTTSVACALAGAGHHILFRLTKARFKSLCRGAEAICRTARGVRYRLTWVPSWKNHATRPDLPAGARLEVEMHEVELDNDERLYLVTTLRVASETAAKFYGRRYDVEHDIRDLKVSLGIERIRDKSDDLVQKERLRSIVAYNLVVELRHVAAKLAKFEPRRLSFTGVWTTMQAYLLR